MTNWQERIRGIEQERLALAQQNALEKQRLDNERAMREEETKIKRETDLQVENNHLSEELESVLVQLGVAEKLKEISEQVWRCGDIVKKRDGNYIFASSEMSLVFRYQYDNAIPIGGTPVTHHTTEGGETRTYGGADHWEIGKNTTETSLAVKIGQNKDLKVSKVARNYIVVFDSEIRKWNAFDFDLNSLDKVQLATFLDKEILESCLQRKQANSLPLDLKAGDEQSGKYHIKSFIPWHKRIFYKF